MAARKSGTHKTVFEQRVLALCTEHGTTPTELGTKAGLSPQTVRTWMDKAAAGKLKRTADMHKFATYYKRTVDWLMGEVVLVEVPPEALRPDTKAMAEEAVEMLVDIDGLTRAEAAERMLGIFLDPPSVKGYYKAARLQGAPRTTSAELDAPGARKPRKGR